MSEIQKPVFSSPYENLFIHFNMEKPLSIPAAENPLSIPTAGTHLIHSHRNILPRFTLHPHQKDSLKIRFVIIRNL